MDGSILETRQAIGEAKVKVDGLKSSASFNPNAILEAQQDLAAYEKGLSALQALKEELF